MSLELVRQVSAEHPTLLRQNLVSTCYQHTVFVIEKLRAKGLQAFHVCKSPGESQYTPPGFQPRDVVGLDGKTYRCSGVSPDAIWCEGTIVDTIASANENDRPIYRRDGDPNWSFDPNDGPQIVGVPVWNIVAPNNWRNNNPPLKDGVVIPVPPPTPQHDAYPGDAVFDAIGEALFADYAAAGNPPNAQMGRWFGRTVYDWLVKNEPTLQSSINKHQKEWRALLGL